VFKRFFLHYNFPPWSVGEVRRIMGPGRREIGHGHLAERALGSVLPFDHEEDPFPYTLRIVSDITESNGSSSMASVCGGSLSLMDAGVPTKAAVAGIAMGMIKEGAEVRILSDIIGAEDHLGDMDFKVCGTRKGITAFQMDVKVSGLSRDVMQKALEQAHAGRMHILDKMDECLPKSRPEISPYAPRIFTIKIDVDKIREVIGPGGKVVRDIQAKTGADIDIEDDGTIHVASADSERAQMAIEMIQNITADVEMGKVYHGTVTRTTSFGAFVNILGKKEGLVRIPDLAVGRVNRVEDVVRIGDELDVKVIEIDHVGRINLSKVEADYELGRVTEDDIAEHKRNRRDGPAGRGPAPRGSRDHDSRRGGDRNRGGRGGERKRH
jgi:polyribonucleotide nucleotidyltransferase